MGKRVLVIEDDAELGAQIVARLQAAGYETTWWHEGRRLCESGDGVAFLAYPTFSYNDGALYAPREREDEPVSADSAVAPGDA